MLSMIVLLYDGFMPLVHIYIYTLHIYMSVYIYIYMEHLYTLYIYTHTYIYIYIYISVYYAGFCALGARGVGPLAAACVHGARMSGKTSLNSHVGT